MSKHECYQDYVIKGGKLIGEFEKMYQDFEDPWEQTAREQFASEKAIAINWCKKLRVELKRAPKVVELGCGLGLFSNAISNADCSLLGCDVSETAINKARNSYPDCQFRTADILDFNIYENFKPDVFVMAEITWYVLEKLDLFISYLKKNHKGAYLIHLLNTYPEGCQEYGKDYFTNLQEILQYFNLHFIEFGEVTCDKLGACKRTFFLAKV